MSEEARLRVAFEEVVSANRYMVLATSDENGVPWASPVWFATEDFHEYYWVSRPGARHSSNLATRPEVGVTIFDSQQPPGTSLGVYLFAVAGPVPEPELDPAIAIFSDVCQRAGAPGWARADVTRPARFRLYRASALERFTLSERDERIRLPNP